tara:strand:+ start:154 stop:768 length:615 start_codon:yes stop_codon:yes gene_type:complete
VVISEEQKLSPVIELSNFSQTVTLTGEADAATGLDEVPIGVFIDPVTGSLNDGLTRTETDSSVTLSGFYSGVFGTEIKYFEEELITSDEALTAEGFKALKEKYPTQAAQGKVVQPTVTNDVLSIPTTPPQTLYSYKSFPPLTVVVQYNIKVYYHTQVSSVTSMTRTEHEQGVVRDSIKSLTYTLSQTVNFDESVPKNTIKSYYP